MTNTADDPISFTQPPDPRVLFVRLRCRADPIAGMKIVFHALQARLTIRSKCFLAGGAQSGACEYMAQLRNKRWYRVIFWEGQLWASDRLQIDLRQGVVSIEKHEQEERDGLPNFLKQYLPHI